MTRSALSGVAIVATVVALSTIGCEKMDSKKASLHGVKYEFPIAQISASVFPPDGRLFVRLAPPGVNFHLILDEFNPYLPNKLGLGVPTISRVNDNRFGEFMVIQSSGGSVICEEGPQPHFNCGLEVEDGPVKWSVLFDKEYVGQSAAIRTHAASLIDSYRSDYAERR